MYSGYLLRRLSGYSGSGRTLEYKSDDGGGSGGGDDEGNYLYKGNENWLVGWLVGWSMFVFVFVFF